MKILIVDDNVAVQEIIKDILIGEGHEAQVASSVDEAVQKFEEFSPEIIILDTWVEDTDGLRVISRCHEEHPDSALNVILVKSSSEQVPKDNPFIKGFIDKPFKSADVINVLADVYELMLQEMAEELPKKRRKPISLFKKKKEKIPETTLMIEDQGLRFGESNVIFEKEPDEIYRYIGLFNPDVYDVMVVSSDKAKAIKERFDATGMEIITLAAGKRADAFDIRGLGTLMAKINTFVSSKSRPVVVFDNFSDLVEANGLSPSLVMMHQLVKGPHDKEATFAVSVDSKILTDKDREILLHDMRQYNFRK